VNVAGHQGLELGLAGAAGGGVGAWVGTTIGAGVGVGVACGATAARRTGPWPPDDDGHGPVTDRDLKVNANRRSERLRHRG